MRKSLRYRRRERVGEGYSRLFVDLKCEVSEDTCESKFSNQ